MADRTILIHGWSDASTSFRALKDFLVREGVGDVETVLYADYESREDSLTFNDIVDGLNDNLVRHGIVDADGTGRQDVNVVVHSTGGLVIRHWIHRYYRRRGDRIAQCPVKRIVMLAPANFGSPLAHRGKSFVGSVLRGRRGFRDFLETGRQVLSGLELASPYQWTLAEGDVLTPDPYYLPERIQLTVLVGADEYTGFRGLVSKDGTDGTVVIAGTPLNSVRFLLDPCKPEGEGPGRVPYDWTGVASHNRTAFGVLPGHDHGSVVGVFEEDDAARRPLPRYLLRALRTAGAADFEALRDDLADATRTTYREEGRVRYQQFLVRAVDDQGVAIDDFHLEFGIRKASKRGAGGWMRNVRSSRAEEELSEEAQKLMTREFHRHTEQPSHRRFLLAPDEIGRLLATAEERLGGDATLTLTVHVPPVDRGIRYDTARLESVALHPARDEEAGAGTPSLLYPNTTTLLEIRVDRVNDYVTLGKVAREH